MKLTLPIDIAMLHSSYLGIARLHKEYPEVCRSTVREISTIKRYQLSLDNNSKNVLSLLMLAKEMLNADTKNNFINIQCY